MRRALTMVEMLVALGLLSILAATLLSWTQASLRGGAEALQHARWRSAAEVALQLIHDDLVTGDVATNPEKPEAKFAVDAAASLLTVHCRESGWPVIHRYEVDRDRDALILTIINERSQARAARTLLTLVENLKLALDEKTSTLTVAIGSSSGLTVERKYAVLP